MSEETLELKVPSPGESVSEVQIAKWLKKAGDAVSKDDELAELESEKATLPLVCPADGRLESIVKPEGEFARVNEVIALMIVGASANGAASGSAPAKPAESAKPAPAERPASSSAPASAPAAAPSNVAPAAATPTRPAPPTAAPPFVMPAAARVLAERGLSAGDVTGTGPGGRITKSDATQAPAVGTMTTTSAAASGGSLAASRPADPREDVKPMTMLRRTIANRLVQAQHEAALLTTFNEVDMSAVMDVRSRYKDDFAKKHGVKLGFMSFFAKASVEALKRFPAVNAEIRGNNVVYKNYYDIGVAIGGGKGLVVPVVRDCDALSFAGIEKAIGDLAAKAQANKLKPADLEGGTFTISNGGVYGSLLSTPIVNMPQSGVLGLHSIQERPIAVKGQVVVRPMMYLALSYDHRIIDGREAVTFLKTIKDMIEDPSRLMLDL